jgi:uncharacterized repeat protein (TIGR01451 family)
MCFALTLCLAISIFIPVFSSNSYAASQPDLVIAKAAITSKIGTTIKYTYTIKNNGTVTIPSLYYVSIQAYFSANTVFGDAGDVAAGGSILGINRSLAPGESYTSSYGAYGSVPSGMNYVTIKIDFNNYVAESNENNNTYYFSSLPGTTKMVTLRPEIENRGIAVRDQAGRGICVHESMTFLQEYLLTGAYGSTYNQLSLDYAIQASNVATGSRTEDTCFREYNMGYATYGAVSNSYWPFNPNYVYNYDTSNATFNKLTSTGSALLKDGYRLAGKCLREGYYGTLTDAEITAVQNYIDRGIPVAQAHSGHSTAIVGYELNSSYAGGGRFIYRNSWGPSWGDGGYGTYTFSEMKQTNLNVALFVYEIASVFPKIYRDINYTGFNIALAAGSYTLDQLQNLGVLNDDISSIIIPGGYTAYLYEHDNFQGTCKILTSSNANFVNLGFNDTVSSIIIIKN